jgi:transcriptional regulator with XRE-family HTH domain
MRRPAEVEPPNELDTIGKRVRFLMHIRGTSLSELDQLLGKGRGYASRLVTDEREPRMETLGAIAKAMRAPVSWFTGEQRAPALPVLAARTARIVVNRERRVRGEAMAEAVVRMCAGGGVQYDDSNVRLDADLVGLSAADILAAFGLSGVILETREEFLGREEWIMEDIHDGAEAFVKSQGHDFILSRKSMIEFLDNMAVRNFYRAKAFEELAHESRQRREGMLAEARRTYPAVPASIFDKVIELPWHEIPGIELDATLLGEVARSVHDAALRGSSKGTGQT